MSFPHTAEHLRGHDINAWRESKECVDYRVTMEARAASTKKRKTEDLDPRQMLLFEGGEVTA